MFNKIIFLEWFYSWRIIFGPNFLQFKEYTKLCKFIFRIEAIFDHEKCKKKTQKYNLFQSSAKRGGLGQRPFAATVENHLFWYAIGSLLQTQPCVKTPNMIYTVLSVTNKPEQSVGCFRVMNGRLPCLCRQTSNLQPLQTNFCYQYDDKVNLEIDFQKSFSIALVVSE